MDQTKGSGGGTLDVQMGGESYETSVGRACNGVGNDVGGSDLGSRKIDMAYGTATCSWNQKVCCTQGVLQSTSQKVPRKQESRSQVENTGDDSEAPGLINDHSDIYTVLYLKKV